MIPVARHLRCIESMLRAVSAINDAMLAMVEDLEADVVESDFGSVEIPTLSTSLSHPLQEPPTGPRKRSSNKMNAITPDTFERYLRLVVGRAKTDADRHRARHILEESRVKGLLKSDVIDALLAEIGC